MKLVAGLLSLSSVLSAVLGVRFLQVFAVGPGVEVGKWLLTLSTVFLGGGFLSVLVKLLEDRRNVRNEYAELLRVVISLDQEVDSAGLLMRASKSLPAYAERVSALMKVSSHLRAETERKIVRDNSELKLRVTEARSYIKQLGEEFAGNYERLQLVPAQELWQKLTDPVELPALSQLLDVVGFEQSAFKGAIGGAKKEIRRCAGM